MTYMYVYSKSIFFSFTFFQNQNSHIDNPTFKCSNIDFKCLDTQTSDLKRSKLNVQTSHLKYSYVKHFDFRRLDFIL
jgi:hypothetical protein